AQSLEREIAGASTRVIGRDEALAEYRELAGFGLSLETLGGRNPLPAIVVVTMRGPTATPERMRGLLETLDARKEVELAQLDLAWMQKLDAMLTLMQRAILAVAAVFALGVVLIVGNTIRLAVERRSEEIEIVRLFGATDAFVRRPFLYAGSAYGLAGGALALVLVGFAQLGLSGPVLRLASLYASDFRLQGLGFGASFAVLAAGALLGLVGAWASVSSRLRVQEPG
ncbi:MAG: cell division protein FtsX, partial [Gammaproteobacteria bacterium]